MEKKIETTTLTQTHPYCKKVEVEGDNDAKQTPLQLNCQGRCFSCLRDSSEVTISTAFHSLSDILSKLEVPVETTISLLLRLRDLDSSTTSGKNLLNVEVEVKLCHSCSEIYSGLSELFKKLEKAERKLKAEPSTDNEVQDNDGRKVESPKSKKRKVTPDLTASELAKKVDKTTKKLKQALVSVRKGIEAGDTSGLDCLLALEHVTKLGDEAKKHLSVVKRLRKDIKEKCEDKNIEAMFGGKGGGADGNACDRTEGNAKSRCGNEEEKSAIDPCDSTTTDYGSINVKEESRERTESEIVTVDLEEDDDDHDVILDPISNPVPSSVGVRPPNEVPPASIMTSNTSQAPAAPIPSGHQISASDLQPSFVVAPHVRYQMATRCLDSTESHSVWPPVHAARVQLHPEPSLPAPAPVYQSPLTGYPSFSSPTYSSTQTRDSRPSVAPASIQGIQEPPPTTSSSTTSLPDPTTQWTVVMRNGIKHFACTQCSRVLSTQTGLTSHFKAKHKMTSTTCEYCKKVIEGTGTDILLHRRFCKKGQPEGKWNVYTCEYCDMKIEGPKSEFKSHRANCHNNEYRCIYCNMQYFHRQLLAEHIMNSHSGRKMPSDVKLSSSSQSGATTTAAGPPRPPPMTLVPIPLPCNACLSTFRDSGDREKHYREFPLHRNHSLHSIFSDINDIEREVI